MNTDTKTDHENSGMRPGHAGARMVNTVVMKFTPLGVLEAPSMTMPAMNAVVPGLAVFAEFAQREYGGYITQVMSAPCRSNARVDEGRREDQHPQAEGVDARKRGPWRRLKGRT
ncbi:MAG: hypothetical protein CM15mP128_1900 [Methanobacteriota archaeon]|nr:MAG: hypothetical protein CM15mP128_1900 [Euryarchaeota archaeon]